MVSRYIYISTVYIYICYIINEKNQSLYVLGPKSFTGEDSFEFQIHGGRAVITSILQGLSKLSDFRPADPGKIIILNG